MIRVLCVLLVLALSSSEAKRRTMMRPTHEILGATAEPTEQTVTTTASHLDGSENIHDLNYRHGYQLFPAIGLYKLHTDRRTWGGAWTACRNESAHLVIVNSRQEAAALRRLIGHLPDDDFVSVGIHDFFVNDEYVTIFGDDILSSWYSIWAPGEPSNHGNERCGTINNKVELSNVVCDSEQPFVCEKELQE